MHRLLVGAAVAFGILSGSSLAEAPPADIVATIKMYQRTNASIQAVTEAAIARFKARYPNVAVENQWLPLGTWGEYISGFLNQVASGDVPDILEVAIEGFSTVARQDLLLPLNEVISKDESAKELLDDIEPNLLAGMSYGTGGELYFFPTSWNNVLTFYNKDLFDAAGVPYPENDWTWEEFAETAKALTVKDASGNTVQYGYFVPGSNFTVAPWYLTNGVDLLRNNWTESNVTDPKFAEAMKFLHDLIHEAGAAPNFERGVSDAQFTAGQVAMFSAGHWPTPTIIESGLKNVGVVMMPNNGSQVTVFGVGGLGITKQTEHPELVWELVKELTGPEAQQQYAETRRNIPATRTAAQSPDYIAFPDHSEVFYDTASTAIPISAPPNFAEVEEIFMRNLELYLTDNVDLDTMIATLDSELSRSLSRLR